MWIRDNSVLIPDKAPEQTEENQTPIEDNTGVKGSTSARLEYDNSAAINLSDEMLSLYQSFWLW